MSDTTTERPVDEAWWAEYERLRDALIGSTTRYAPETRDDE